MTHKRKLKTLQSSSNKWKWLAIASRI